MATASCGGHGELKSRASPSQNSNPPPMNFNFIFYQSCLFVTMETTNKASTVMTLMLVLIGRFPWKRLNSQHVPVTQSG